MNTYLVLNEINQYAHRLDEKPAHFKLADICQPVCIEGEDIYIYIILLFFF